MSSAPETTGSRSVKREAEASSAKVDPKTIRERKCFLCVRRGLVDRLALRVQPGKIGRVDVETPALLRLEDELDLTYLLHDSIVGLAPRARR